MLKVVHGNLLEDKAEALVNTVNTVGVMGKGIALQFKKAVPDNFEWYAKACKHGRVRLGEVLVYSAGMVDRPKYIINFPTKGHWRSKSRLKDIESGLDSLANEIKKLNIRSIAVPPLGSGLGGLPWLKVRKLIEQKLGFIEGLEVRLYEPAGAPAASDMKVRTKKPKMTLGRAVLLKLIDQYSMPLFCEHASLLEIQKLAYFMQCAGQPLKLEFQKGPYGPYADNLRHVLNHIEGHYVSGWGDGQNKPGTEINLLPGAIDEADQYLKGEDETLKRFERVAKLIEGFETQYGMELLGTVHWVLLNELGDNKDHEEVIRRVREWTPRKGKMFSPEHIINARHRLEEGQWHKQNAC